MPKLDSISISNYRSFAERTDLELSPLTLLYGRNGAGKSTLLRLLPLIGDSVGEGASSPLDLSGDAGRRSSFGDLKWKGAVADTADPNLRLGFSWSGESSLSRIEYGLDFSRERRVTLIKELAAFDHTGALVLSARHVPEPEERNAKLLHYDLRDGNRPEKRLRLDFVGLVPEPCLDAPHVGLVREHISGLRGTIQWLTALHQAPERLNPDLGSMPKRMSGSGKEAASILRSDRDVLGDVARYYRERWSRTLEIVEAPPNNYRILLRPDPTMDVDLIDSGEGTMQILPVLVGVAMARRHYAGGPSILAVEEPESQLHPDAQRDLARHLCEIAGGVTPPVIVLETHSSSMLLAVQLEIAAGRLPKDRALAYWIHQGDDHRSRAERVTFDAQGRPEGNWPPGVFADDRELARELVKEQLKNMARRPS